MGKAGPLGSRKFDRVVKPQIIESSLPAHLEISDESIPAADASPTAPGVQVYAIETKSGRNQFT